MSVVVTKFSPVVIRPSEPVTVSGTIKLSPVDNAMQKVPLTVFLVFEHPIRETTETIKSALSRALVHYYPFAGRIVAGDDCESHIQYNANEGVAFVAAAASGALKDALLSVDQSTCTAEILDKLSVDYPAGGGGGRRRTDDPLLVVQVTEFSCGGFVLAVTWDHAVADGAGMAQFLQAVGELAGGSPSPSVAPVRRLDDSVWSYFPSTAAQQRRKGSLDPPGGLAYLDFNIPSRLINSIKDGFSSRFSGKQCTTFEAVTAVVWQCRSRAIASDDGDPEAPATLLYAANARRHVGAQRGYYGNCLAPQLVMARSGMVAHGDIVDLVGMIKQSKEKIPDQFIRNSKGGEAAAADQQAQQEHLQLQDSLYQVRHGVVTMSSWRDLGLEAADFGSGKPARVIPGLPRRLLFPLFVIHPPCKGRDGVDVSSALVKQEQAASFLGELARFA